MRTSQMLGTDLMVSELSFGTLTLGPLQADVSPEEGARVIRRALEHGINLFESSRLYGTYTHLALGLAEAGDAMVALKSKECSYHGMRYAVEEALRETKRDHIDIFCLHQITSNKDFAGRGDALKCLTDLRDQGLVRAVGITTHRPQGVTAVLDCEDVQAIHPVVNMNGYGIVEGTLEDMLSALKAARLRGKGIYAQKTLAGGNLVRQIPAAVAYVRGLGLLDSICIGMKTVDEVEMNVRLFENRPVPASLLEKTLSGKKRVYVYDRCVKCGSCEPACEQGAITVGEDKAEVDASRCILCGYCALECPERAIRVW